MKWKAFQDICEFLLVLHSLTMQLSLRYESPHLEGAKWHKKNWPLIHYDVINSFYVAMGIHASTPSIHPMRLCGWGRVQFISNKRRGYWQGLTNILHFHKWSQINTSIRGKNGPSCLGKFGGSQILIWSFIKPR